MERLPAEKQARPRRHIAALSGRYRAMAETYGEAGGPKRGAGLVVDVAVEVGRGFLFRWAGSAGIRGRAKWVWG